MRPICMATVPSRARRELRSQVNSVNSTDLDLSVNGSQELIVEPYQIATDYIEHENSEELAARRERRQARSALRQFSKPIP